MPVFLLDVNVLIALAWSHHQHHLSARRWFASLRPGDQWATCPMTQCGFVRVSAIPKFAPQPITPAQAFRALNGITAQRAHLFWPDDLPFAGQPHIPPERLTGHRMVTDAYLLALCLRHSGRLATYDGGIAALATSIGQPNVVQLIPP